MSATVFYSLFALGYIVVAGVYVICGARRETRALFDRARSKNAEPASPASHVRIKPFKASGQLSAAILWDGAEIHNLRIAELTEAWHDQHRTVCADCVDRDTGERYILTATRISHPDGTPDVGA